MKIYKKAKIRYNEINLAYVCMETNSRVVANTLNRILRYKGSTLYRALTVYNSIYIWNQQELLYKMVYKLYDLVKVGRKPALMVMVL